MELLCYSHMSRKSRRKFIQRKYRYGKEIPYKPPGGLIKVLNQRMGLPKTTIYNQLIREREHLLRELGLT